MLTFALIGGSITGDNLPIAPGLMTGVTLFGGMASIVPAIIAVAAIEFFRLRSVLYSIAAGGLVGAVSWQTTNAWDGFADVGESLFAFCLAAGFVGGVVYWFCAGRDAGRGLTSSPSG